MSSVKIFLCLSADSFDVEEVTSTLNITPTSAREKSQWPQVSIDAGIAVNEWVFEISEKNCVSVEIPFEKMISILDKKTVTLLELSRKYGLKISMGVIIYSKAGNLPEIFLNEKIVDYASSINASIGFDMYLEDAKE
jgi:Domain of unknown function (DUF4279)